MRISMSAMYFTVDVLYVSSTTYESTLSSFTITTFCPRAAYGGKERVCGDTPHPGKGLRPLHSLTSTSKGFVPGLPDLGPSALPTHRDLMELQAIWPCAIRLTYLVQVCAN